MSQNDPAGWGELMQRDSSEHDWLEGRGPKLYLPAMIIIESEHSC